MRYLTLDDFENAIAVCEKCGHRQHVFNPLSGRGSGVCPCKDAPDGASLVVGIAGCVIGWVVIGTRPLVAMAAAPQYPIVNEPQPVGDFVEIKLHSLELGLELVSPQSPAVWEMTGPKARNPDIVVRTIRVHRSDLVDAGLMGGADSGAYARGVKAARDAIAAARYDAERTHAEWSVLAVKVPEDAGK